MIGAMPAVTVRHDRGKVNKRMKRTKFHIKGPWKISSSNSTPTNVEADQTFEIEEIPDYYLFGKISTLHVIVGLFLSGAITLIVGVVQLTPGAADADHRFVFLSIGTGLLVLGLLATALRCLYFHWYKMSAASLMHENGTDSLEGGAAPATTTGSTTTTTATIANHINEPKIIIEKDVDVRTAKT